MDEQWELVTKQLALLKERYVYGEALDPVFEGVVRDFKKFDTALQDIFDNVLSFQRTIENLCEGLSKLSDSLVRSLATSEDSLIISDSLKMKEASQQIARADAPFSSLAKFKRDLDYNVILPIRGHLLNNRNIKTMLDVRRSKLLEVTAAQKAVAEGMKKGRLGSLESSFERAKAEFTQVDKEVFDWLFVLDEYKGDLLDSCLQTLKYLQYEFFASSSHAVAAVLPPRIEFRPLVEMTPRQIEAQIEIEKEEDIIVYQIKDHSDISTGPFADYSTRIVERIEKEKLAVAETKGSLGSGLSGVIAAGGISSTIAVDPLSLSAMLAQGFDEGDARKALRMHSNDTQAAVEYLLGGEESPEAGETIVRLPATLARIQRLKEVKRRIQERRSEKEKHRDEVVQNRVPPLDLLDLSDADFRTTKLPDIMSLIDS